VNLNLAWIEPWRARWNALGTRERRALGILAGFLGAVLFTVLVLIPVKGGLAAARVRHAAVQSQLPRVQAQAALVERLRRSPRVAPVTDAAAAVEQAATRHGLREQMKRIDPEGTRAVRVQIEAAPFAAVMAWLVDLQQQGGLRAETASFERHSSPGIVNARIVLRVQGS
jgi:general secretion pathway protein M